MHLHVFAEPEGPYSLLTMTIAITAFQSMADSGARLEPGLKADACRKVTEVKSRISK